MIPTDQVIKIPEVLSALECSNLVALAEKIGFQAALVNTDAGKILNTDYRNNSRAEFNNRQLSSLLWRRISKYTPQRIDGKISTGISDKFKCYRYFSGQQFNWHQDGSIARNMHEKSIYTCMVYLNDGYTGGTTDICLPSGIEAVEPKRGMVLLFRHELRHRGSPVITGVKYALRTDVMYKNNSLY